MEALGTEAGTPGWHWDVVTRWGSLPSRGLRGPVVAGRTRPALTPGKRPALRLLLAAAAAAGLCPRTSDFGWDASVRQREVAGLPAWCLWCGGGCRQLIVGWPLAWLGATAALHHALTSWGAEEGSGAHRAQGWTEKPPLGAAGTSLPGAAGSLSAAPGSLWESLVPLCLRWALSLSLQVSGGSRTLAVGSVLGGSLGVWPSPGLGKGRVLCLVSGVRVPG